MEVDARAPPVRTPAEANSAIANLVVRIFSSFHRGGSPKDETGHGGGFVFDVRACPIPDAKNAQLTGKEHARIDYLRQCERDEYLKNAESLVDGGISNYQSCGFQVLDLPSFWLHWGQHWYIWRSNCQPCAAEPVWTVLRHIELGAGEIGPMPWYWQPVWARDGCPLTNDRPKALVEVGGRTAEITLFACATLGSVMDHQRASLC